MLNIVAIVLFLMWLLGYFNDYRMNGFIHIFLVVALILFVLNILQPTARKR